MDLSGIKVIHQTFHNIWAMKENEWINIMSFLSFDEIDHYLIYLSNNDNEHNNQLEIKAHTDHTNLHQFAKNRCLIPLLSKLFNKVMKHSQSCISNSNPATRFCCQRHSIDTLVTKMNASVVIHIFLKVSEYFARDINVKKRKE